MTSSTTTSRAEQIARLNDAFRRHPGADWFMTSGVQAKGPIFALKAMATVSGFSTFTSDNDPYGERDFGAFDLCGERLFWKIDYYALDLASGSPDPADPAVTRRVLTIMLASEY